MALQTKQSTSRQHSVDSNLRMSLVPGVASMLSSQEGPLLLPLPLACIIREPSGVAGNDSLCVAPR